MESIYGLITESIADYEHYYSHQMNSKIILK